MTSTPHTLHFELPGHEAATLRSMNLLRSEERFCDVTIVSNGLKFKGHRVVLAACSPFLRDQFLLNPISQLQVSLMHGPKVVSDLLLSCYTGHLQFPVREIVNYLTAASYFQMEHVVEKCRQALCQFIDPQIGLVESQRTPPTGNPSSTTTSMYSSRPSDNSESMKSQIKTAEDSEEELLMMAEDEEEEEEEEEESSSNVCIVKLESGADSAGGEKGQRPWAKDDQNVVVQPEEALVNSTVEGGETGEGSSQRGGEMKAVYSDDMDNGEGVLIIPSSYHEDDDEVLEGGMGACQSSFMSDGSLSMGGAALFGSMVFEDTQAGVKRTLRCCKCDESFQGVEKLVFHMRAKHFVFMCPRCGKQFNHSSNLNRHMNVHRGVKSHTCNICGKCFTQKSTLHDHLNLHSGERPYRCSYCDVRFAHKPAIRRHLKEQHGKTTAQNVLAAGVAEMNILMGCGTG
ncbi:zinc finger and BTB domain-containing protein 12 isoform X1 [Hyperolius riggenbachi]|uniref:zinc finger and BTB domain-containing protein 12 isoform X1 n=1 Tax=Hyperolius riggenbachi TaxID=752182 RepID=UPI0035A372CF